MRPTKVLLLVICVALVSFAGTAEAKKDNLLCMLTGSCLSPDELKQAIAAAEAFPLGSKNNPVRSDMPPGERAYLERLRCNDGTAPAFERAGSVGEGPYGTILDLYQLRCSSGQPSTASVYMDMYHRDYSEDRPAPGFTIEPRH
jgi:hypothetical protein